MSNFIRLPLYKIQNKGSINSSMEFGFIVSSDGNILFVHDVLHVYLGFLFLRIDPFLVTKISFFHTVCVL